MFENKRVLVMGLGLHGGAIGNIEWLVSEGARVTVTDLKTEEELQASVETLRERLGEKFEGVKLVLGEHRDEDFKDAEVVLRNPGVRRDSKWLKIADEAGAEIRMDSDIFFEEVARIRNTKPGEGIIGVTGSKGKSTTTNAIVTVLKEKYLDAVVVGFDGLSPLLALTQVEELSADAPIIFELSSWRMEPLDERGWSSEHAVLTSLYREHLNTYDSFDDYVRTKRAIYLHQNKDDLVLLNTDDALVAALKDEAPGRVVLYGLNEGIWDGDLVFESDHERRNVLPAILMGRELGMSDDEIAAGLKKIERLPHRLELVREIDGVQFVNDSAATMPDATIAALHSFAKKKLVLIVGGSDKDLEFEQLGVAIQEANIRALVWLPGTATERMKTEIGATVAEHDVASMEEAVRAAREIADTGEVVLLSPGATSFGLFKHEFDRGDQFRELVAAL